MKKIAKASTVCCKSRYGVILRPLIKIYSGCEYYWMKLQGQVAVTYNPITLRYQYRPKRELDAEFLADLIVDKLAESKE